MVSLSWGYITLAAAAPFLFVFSDVRTGDDPHNHDFDDDGDINAFINYRSYKHHIRIMKSSEILYIYDSN